MALARVVLAGLVTFVACLLVGHSGRNPLPAPPVKAASTTTTTIVVTTTTSEPPHPPTSLKMRASRGETHRSPPETVPGAYTGCAAPGAKPDKATSDACWRYVVARYTDWDVDVMLRVVWCESRGNLWAVNPVTGAADLFQIEGATPGLVEPHVTLAHDIWVRHAMSRWRASRGCWS